MILYFYKISEEQPQEIKLLANFFCCNLGTQLIPELFSQILHFKISIFLLYKTKSLGVFFLYKTNSLGVFLLYKTKPLACHQ